MEAHQGAQVRRGRQGGALRPLLQICEPELPVREEDLHPRRDQEEAGAQVHDADEIRDGDALDKAGREHIAHQSGRGLPRGR